MYQTDILVIGSEGAGARAAIEASRSGLEILIVSKGRMGRSGATITAGADIDVDSKSAKEFLGLNGDINDNKEIFFEDIIIEGKYINNQRMVEIHVEEAPLRVKELIDWGMKVFGLIKAPGHRYPRGVYSSGKEIIRALNNEVKRHSNIKIMNDMMILDLLKSGDCISGAIGLNLQTGELDTFRAKAIIVATGGAQMVYPVHTAPEELTGDGLSMAWRAGADLIDMEMTQFLPGTFIKPLAWAGVGFPFILSLNESMRGWLLNRYGERFMKKWDPKRMENSTRDKLSIAMMKEVIEGRGSPSGGVFLSFAHLPRNLIEFFSKWYGKPYLHDDWTYMGFKFRDLMEKVKNGYALEVGPASHFFMGGIRVNTDGGTSIKGLYAAGEVCGGLHGANRLSGNAIPQILIQGKRAGQSAAKYCLHKKLSKIDNSLVAELKEKYMAPIKRSNGINPWEVKRKIHTISWGKVGPLRNGEGLKNALKEIESIEREDIPFLCCSAKDRVYNREWIESLQVHNLLMVIKAIALSASERVESRGAHYREDYPRSDNQAWLKNIVISNDNGLMKVNMAPIIVTNYTPPFDEK